MGSVAPNYWVVRGPNREESFGGEPLGNEPFGDEPVGDEPFGGEPFGDGPFGDEPFGDELFGDEPVGNESFGDEPFGEEPLGDELTSMPRSRTSAESGQWIECRGPSVLGCELCLRRSSEARPPQRSRTVRCAAELSHCLLCPEFRTVGKYGDWILAGR